MKMRTDLVLIFMLLASCAAEGDFKEFTIGGKLRGLTGHLTIELNDGGDKRIKCHGSYYFKDKLADGEAYEVKIKAAPPGQRCFIENATGFRL